MPFDDTMDASKSRDREAAATVDYGRFINRAGRIRDLYWKERAGRSLLG